MAFKTVSHTHWVSPFIFATTKYPRLDNASVSSHFWRLKIRLGLCGEHPSGRNTREKDHRRQKDRAKKLDKGAGVTCLSLKRDTWHKLKAHSFRSLSACTVSQHQWKLRGGRAFWEVEPLKSCLTGSREWRGCWKMHASRSYLQGPAPSGVRTVSPWCSHLLKAHLWVHEALRGHSRFKP